MTLLSPSFALLAAALVVEVTAVPIINSPTTLVQCQPSQLTWSGATPPVYLSAVEGTSTSSTPLIQFTPQMEGDGSLTWDHVNITSGTTITLMINDGKGVNNFSGQVTIKPGADDCQPSIGSGTPSAATQPPTGGAAAAAGGTAAGGTTSGTTTPPASTSSTTSSPAAHNNTQKTTASTPTNSSTTASSTSGSSGGVFASAGSLSFTSACAAMAGVLIATGLF